MWLREWTNLLRWHVKRNGTQVNFGVRVNAGHDEEHARSFGAARQDAAQSEHDRSLVLLDHF